MGYGSFKNRSEDQVNIRFVNFTWLDQPIQIEGIDEQDGYRAFFNSGNRMMASALNRKRLHSWLSQVELERISDRSVLKWKVLI